MFQRLFLRKKPNLFFDALVVTGCLMFGVFVLWHFRYFTLLIESDRSYLSLVILALYTLVTVGWLAQCHRLAALQSVVSNLKAPAHQNNESDRLATYLILQHQILGLSEPQTLSSQRSVVSLADHLQNPHALGYFVSDLLLKLGLMGTVIGFILMLGPIAEIKQFEPALMQQLLTAMSGGMAIALYTTLTGLVTSTLIKSQYHLADHAVVQIINTLEWLESTTGSTDASPQP
ncbi:MAG: hypothetical protein ACJASJ_000715 [Candidatus Azotimanducaceae bacterium]